MSVLQSNINMPENTSKIEKEILSNNALIDFYKSNWREILTEFISTTLLLLFGCMACVPIDGFTLQPPMYGPLGFGLTVLVNVHTFGHISGAHMNPVVTLVAVLTGNTSVSRGITYVIAQCLGATTGYGILVGVSPIELISGGICATIPHANQNALQTLGVEIALTATLSFVCCSAWDPVNKNNQDSMALKFGFVIAGLSIAGAPFTGASMNPARSLGPAIWTNTWTVHWAYWVGPIIGGILAVVIYRLITTAPEKNEK